MISKIDPTLAKLLRDPEFLTNLAKSHKLTRDFNGRDLSDEEADQLVGAFIRRYVEPDVHPAVN